ncbi:MAG: hypothetical protein ACYDDE_00550 [bacterium]
MINLNQNLNININKDCKAFNIIDGSFEINDNLFVFDAESQEIIKNNKDFFNNIYNQIYFL